jgi:hypothetical protein
MVLAEKGVLGPGRKWHENWLKKSVWFYSFSYTLQRLLLI